VVVPDAEGLNHEDMQQIARGMGPMETAFVTPPQDANADFCTHFFTSTTRVPFSGHPALGTAYVLAKEGRFDLEAPITTVYIETGIGVLPIELHMDDDEIRQVVMTEQPPEFGATFDDLGELAAGLNIGIEGLLEVPLPIQWVSTGMPTLVTPIASLEAVQDIRPHHAVLDEICATMGADCILVFCLETIRPEATAHVRVFAPPLGVDEDPATGAANGALGAYLAHYQAIPLEPVTKIHVEQGFEIGRPSMVHVIVDTTGDDFRVQVGGCVFRSVDGHIFF
jgi:trans-2,3-dihydro-3-hydroxyanthranilate isomerase